MRKFLVLFMTVLLACSAAIAQTRTVTGRVTDEQGNPVPFASVKIRGTNNGVTASAEGTFKITAAPNAVLEISSVGYTATTVAASSNDLSVRMVKDNSQTLSEVVVTGAYNTKRTARST